ncbi:MAG: DNA internalization-related competence protein ComEC/Rec2 [Methylotenera sp.]|nr:DNA internalization-related competence protein ComEC/Rec2 [Methylotenera sp.]
MILFALAFVLGAFCLQQAPSLPSLYWYSLPIPFGLAYSLISLKFAKKTLAVLLCFLLGFFWAAGFASWRLHDALPHAWEGKPIEVTGVVASMSERTERGERFRFNVENIQTPHAVVPTHLSLNYYASDYAEEVTSAPAITHFKAGERWRLTVRLKRPHGTQNPHGFDFESWALAENIRATGSIKAKAFNQKLTNFVWQPRYVIEHLRELTQQRIVHVLGSQVYRGIIQALVMGDDSQISATDWQLFLRTGTSHLMSISGLHITMLAGLAFGITSFGWRRIPALALRAPARKAATLAGVLTALLYALIAGFSVPTQRTLYMLIVFALALWTGRKWVTSQVLATALLTVVLLDPWAVIAPGFWLSFGAVALLAYAMGGRIGHAHWLKTALHTQWIVTIGMLPLLLVMFHQASIISPIANAFAIPLISFVVTPLALLGSFLPIDTPLHLAYQALTLGMKGLAWCNQLSIALWQQHTPAIWTLLPALLGVFYLLLPRGVPVRWLGLTGLLPMLMIVPERPAMGEMKITVLDVGQGLSVVVQTAQHQFLYDAGAKYTAQSDAGSRIVVPFLQGEGIQKLNGFMVSHNDNDHSGGMASVLNLMPVDWLASSLPSIETNSQQIKCFAGQHWMWDGVQFEVLHPSFESYNDLSIKDNNRSCVLKISNATGSLLLTGDIEKSVEESLVLNQTPQLKSDVLIAAHHGSKTSSSPTFIEAVAPKIVVFTSGYLNRFKHPVPQVVSRFTAQNIASYRSDHHGAITFNFAQSVELVAWRKNTRKYWHDQLE